MKKRKTHFQRLEQRRAKARRFSNPYFSRPSSKRRMFVWGAVATILVLAGISLYMLLAPQFMIRTVEVTGAETVAEADLRALGEEALRERVAFAFPRANRWLFDAKAMKARIQESYAFESLEVERIDERIVIRVEEKPSGFVWVSAGASYVAGEDGTLIRRHEPEEPESPEEGEETADAQEGQQGSEQARLPVIRDLNDVYVEIGDRVLEPQEYEGITRFHRHLTRQRIGMEETLIDRLAGKWVAVETTDGYEILFDPEGDIDGQAANLETVLRESVDDPLELQYVDLRFGDRVYFK